MWSVVFLPLSLDFNERNFLMKKKNSIRNWIKCWMLMLLDGNLIRACATRVCMQLAWHGKNTIFKKKSKQTPTAAPPHYTRSFRFESYAAHMGEIIEKIIINWRRKIHLLYHHFLFVCLCLSLCLSSILIIFYCFLVHCSVFVPCTLHRAHSLKEPTTVTAAPTIDSIMCSLK